MDKYLPSSFNKELLRITDFRMFGFLPRSLPDSSAKTEQLLFHLFFPGRNGNPVRGMRG